MEPILPSELQTDQMNVAEPEAILSTRTKLISRKQITEWLIQWKDKPLEEATWERADDIRIQFSQFCLEDKASVSGGGIDENQVGHEIWEAQPKMLKVYSRRKKTSEEQSGKEGAC